MEENFFFPVFFMWKWIGSYKIRIQFIEMLAVPEEALDRELFGGVTFPAGA